MATLKDVAKRAGVSIATVSYVLNNRTDKVSDEVAQRVRQVVKELNYSPNMMAKALRMNKTNILGVLSEDITTYQVNNIIQGINQVAEEKNYQMVLADLGLSEKIWNGKFQDYSLVLNHQKEIEEKLKIFKSAGVRGIIYVGMHDRDVTGLVNTDIPLAYAYCYTNKLNDIAVDSDNEHISLEVVDKMIIKGHRRIGLISGPIDSIPAYRRLIGYQRALMHAGIAMDPDLIVYGNWGEKSGYIGGKKLMELADPPTAIFCMNDWMALGVMRALREKKISVPEQVAIVGFDNIDICEFVNPRLTSVSVPLLEIGREVTKTIIASIEDGNVDFTHKDLKCKLDEKESFRSC